MPFVHHTTPHDDKLKINVHNWLAVEDRNEGASLSNVTSSGTVADAMWGAELAIKREVARLNGSPLLLLLLAGVECCRGRLRGVFLGNFVHKFVNKF